MKRWLFSTPGLRAALCVVVFLAVWNLAEFADTGNYFAAFGFLLNIVCVVLNAETMRIQKELDRMRDK